MTGPAPARASRRGPWLLLALVAAIATPWLLLDRWPVEAPELTSAPLRAATAAADGPRFRKVPSRDSGLAFANELRPENRYTYLTNGAGVAVGDYDRDGLPDLYFVSQDGPNRLYRQTAPLRFADVTASAGGDGPVDGGEAWGTGATFADVDGDGWLDLYVCNMEAKNLLYRNRGDGTFEECAARFGLDVAAASTMAAFCDFDRDGDLDVYLLTNRALHAGLAQTPEVLAGIRPPRDTVRDASAMVPPAAVWRAGQDADPQLLAAMHEHFFPFHGRIYMAGQSDRLLRNDGGRFVDGTERAGFGDIGMGLSASWWDYDQDGWPDLYVANDLESPDTLWHNQGDGTFRDVTRSVLPHTAYYGMGADSGDVDGDGRLDFFVADMSATTHKKAKILMGDMDAQRDFLIHGDPQQQMRNQLYVSTGTARFQEAARIAGVSSTDWTWSALFGDLDNDGRLDLFCTNGIARFDMDPDLQLRIAALTKEGRADEAIAEIRNVRSVAEQNQALRNTGDLQFEKTGAGTTANWGLDWQGISHGAVLCDLDRDGDLDVVTNEFDAECGLWENTTADGHAIAFVLRGRGQNPYGIGARVELRTDDGLQVRENWLSRGYMSGQEPRVCFGLGAAARARQVVVRWPSGSMQVFDDLEAGREYTVREPATITGALLAAAPTPAPAFAALDAKGPQATHRETPFDDYEAQFLLPHKLSQLGPGIAFGDADGDGDDDLWVSGAAGQPGSLLRNDGGGAFAAAAGPWQQDAGCEDMGALWLDADGDGDLDLLVASGGVECGPGSELLRDRLYRNDGGLRFVRDADALPDLRDSSGPVCAADFDGDGDLDLFVGSRVLPGGFPESTSSRLLRNDGGRFVDVTAELAPALRTAGMVCGAVWLPIGDDPFPDLLLAAQWQPLRLLHNTDGRAFVDGTDAAGLGACNGLWNSLAALDADGDGDLDFVAGNLGRNTKYKANADHPLGLVFADFDDNGSRDLVETKYEGDNLLPVRGRSCSSQAMPFVAEKFPTYEQFASSLLKDIYPEDKLAKATKLEATCLESMLVRNRGDGTFALEPLPRRAQLAPLFGLAVADFDGDGRQDVVAGTNFFSPEPETGHFDGGLGLFLRGEGDGLRPMSPARAGIVAFGDHKGTACADVDGDGWPDVVFANNDGPLQPFAARVPGRALPLRVVLQGPKGNPTGVGAIVEAERADGSIERRQVLAGSGYLSQDSAAVTFARAPSPVVTVRVRWPGGERSEVTEGLDDRVLTIPQR
ncbi:MAG: FG-GAP-like repeat-containing protein [Planctomycetota bacterium]